MTYLWISIALVLGLIFGFYVRRIFAEGKMKQAEVVAKEIVSKALLEAETKKKEIIIQGKVYRLKEEVSRDSKEKEQYHKKNENRLKQREIEIEKKNELAEKRQKTISQREIELGHLKDTIDAEKNNVRMELQRVANMSEEQAREVLLKQAEKEISYDLAARFKNIEEQIRMDSEKKAREIIASAIQRVAVDQTTESTISVVPLPNDDIKGKIIGREGRNIRIFESLTGVDLLIDDTPEVVTISSYDPVKREIGKIALEKLILDGRIHPARIEELVQAATEEVDQVILAEGENTILELGIRSMHPEILKLVGKLKYRSSYSQNVLAHSKEVALIAGAIAAEIHEDVEKSKRAGLLHDIGKAIDREVEGSHAKLGAEILTKYNEAPEVVNAAEAHHGDVPYNSVISSIVQAADAVSASRPGARKEDIQAYVKRIQSLEKICNEFTGVDKSYAVQAGRELRIIVKPTEIDDIMLSKLSYDIVRKIENDVEYPGQIKVLVIRETRAIAYAK